VPTLVIHRAGNTYLTPEHGRFLAAQIPHARYVEVPGNDHVPYLGDSDAIIDEVEEFLTGVRHGTEANRVLVTLLFIDIVGSTEQAAALSDRFWRDLLERFRSAVRQDLARFNGREVDTAGDGFLATFDGPARAIRCGLAVVKSAESVGTSVRVGLHTGECELLGAGVAGIAVHIAARVTGEAGPGEVLVSRTVRDLVAGAGIRFVDRGTHSLKGVPGEWELYAVTG
jgi:class 3 adenylate cyclase